jgi:hypothetical protein
MKTSPERKAQIAETTEFLQSLEPDPDRNAIFYGAVPMASYAFSLDNAISHIWPSLASYPSDDLEAELAALDHTPLFLYQTSCGDLLTKADDEFDSKKELMLATFLREHEYHVIFQNDLFTVLSAE